MLQTSKFFVLRMSLLALILAISATQATSYKFADECYSLNGDIAYGHSEMLDVLTDSTIYDLRKRPNVAAKRNGEYQTTEADDVSIELGVAHVNTFNEREQRLVISIYETRMWWDHRLRFNKTGEGRCCTGNGLHNESAVIVLRKEHFEGINRNIWTPSTYYTNSREAPDVSTSALYIRSDGLVTHTQQVTVDLSCVMDFKAYPFDSHECPVSMSTWEHTLNEVRITAGNITSGGDLLDIQTPVEGSTSFNFGQFDVSIRTKTSYKEDDGKRTVTGTMTFYRDSQSFYLSVFLPDILLHCAIFASLWISTSVAGAAARVSICIIAALAFRIIMSDVYAALPPVSYEIWLVDYMAVSQLIALVALMEFAFIAHLLGKEVHKTTIRKAMTVTKVPALLKDGHSMHDVFEEATRLHVEYVANANSVSNGGHTPFIFNRNLDTSRVSNQDKEMELKNMPSPDDIQGLHKPIDVADDDSRASRNGTSLDNTEIVKEDAPRKIPLSMHDVQHMAHTKDIFDKYDSDSNGKISIGELRVCLRYFGLYFSFRQTIALVEGFLQDHGRSIATEPEIDEPTFFFLLVQHEKYMPFEELNPGLLSGPPSEVVDRVMQLIYPTVLVIKIVFFKYLIVTYH